MGAAATDSTARFDSADLVVVGAGSAGAVIASRMTERDTHDVLLVEAGPDYAEDAHVPSDLRDGTRNSMRAHDWGYTHKPTAKSIPFDYPRGRVVGGSSAVNTCIALRGQPYDYDEWAARGLPEWSFEACLPAFKRLETDLDVDNEWHGHSGPIPIRRHTLGELSPWQTAFLEACDALGYTPCADTNDPTTTGYGPHAMNKVNGERMSAARCYLTPAVRRRRNLRIRANTEVRRVLFENRRVVGLEVERYGRVHTIRTNRVVLAAGAIATPGVLLRSGIGPWESVARLGVELVQHLPAVAARLLDHPGVAIFLLPTVKGLADPSWPLIQNVLRYTSAGGEYPNDMQVQPGSFVPLPWVTLPLVSIMACVGKPQGFGRITFTSPNLRIAPRLDSDFLSNAHDRACAVAAIELAYALATTKAMAPLAKPLWPRPSTLTRGSVAIDAFLAKICGSGYHPCGTVPMGAEGAEDAAVDGRGRVRGVEGLVVADASLMPTITSSNTNVPTLMIGERFGAWLRDGGIF